MSFRSTTTAATSDRRPRTRDERVRAATLRWLVPVIALFFAVPPLPYALDGWSVAHGEGQTGIFTAVQVGDCGKRCPTLGDFAPDGATVPTRRGVQPLLDLGVRNVGDQVPVVLFKGDIYPAGGGDAWQIYGTLSGTGWLALGAWGAFMARRIRRRRSQGTQADADA